MLEKARALSPYDGYIVDSVGWAYYRLGRYDDAAKTLESAVLLVPGDPTINDHLGDAYWQRRPQARRAFPMEPRARLRARRGEKPKIEKKLETGWNPVATRPEAVRVVAPAKINLFLHVGAQAARRLSRSAKPRGVRRHRRRADARTRAAIFARDRRSVRARPGGRGRQSRAAGGARAGRTPSGHRGRAHPADEEPARRLGHRRRIGRCGGGVARLLALYDENVAEDELLAIAASLGSDMPVCVASQTAWMEGRGEIVTPLPASAAGAIVLVNPGVVRGDGRCVRRLTIRAGEAALTAPAAFASLDALVGYLKTTRNDLEAPARAIAPVDRCGARCACAARRGLRQDVRQRRDMFRLFRNGSEGAKRGRGHRKGRTPLVGPCRTARGRARRTPAKRAVAISSRRI